MNINVLNTNFQKIAVVDTFTSLMWCKRYYEVGALDLEIEASVENLNIFKKHYYITRDDDDAIFRIEAIELDTDENGDDKLIIGAVDCKDILNQRITWSQVFLRNTTVENFIKAMVFSNFINAPDEKRNIVNFLASIPDLTTARTTRQSTYDVIGDKIIELCRESELGCKVSFINNKFVFTLYKGVDRSTLQNEVPRLIFSYEFENLFSTKYNFDSTEFKNVALVGGEGEGLDRKLKEVGTAAGIERREMFVDASSASNEEGGDLADYMEALENEGKEKLAETAATTSFEGEIDAQSYKYKEDYDLGDLVTISNKYGITTTARITEVIETWDDEGYTVEPKFEYVEEDINISEVLFTEEDLPLLTENTNPLLYETSPLIAENEDNYLVTEDNQYIVLED